MALTPDQEKLKEAALQLCSGAPYRPLEPAYYKALYEFDHLANPAAILAILAQLEQVQGWQPIETAPKDGTEIWAFNGEQARMLWSEGSSGSERWALWVWADELLQDADPSPDQPTYFQPIPPPPEAA